MKYPVIAQQIIVEWTKKSRGMPLAATRNAVPEFYPISEEHLSNDIWFQSIFYNEHDLFQTPKIRKFRKVNSNQLRESRLAVNCDGAYLEVLSWGIPGREAYGIEKQAGLLKKNQWLRIIGNVRVVLETTWGYRKYAYNVFWGNPLSFNEIISSAPPQSVLVDEVGLK